MPSRRRFVRTSATMLGCATAVGLSGCLGTVGIGEDGPPEVREESNRPPDRGVPTAFPELSTHEAVSTLAVGRGSEHHQVWVWNATDAGREVVLEIAGAADGEHWFRETYALDGGESLVVDLRESRRYAIRVGVGDRETTVEVPESQFDCNDSATDIAVRESDIENGTISTQMACGGS